MALEKIECGDALERIVKKCRTKSKKITQTAKAKINAINIAKEKPQKLLKARKSIYLSLETLQKHGYNDNLSTELSKLKSAWNEIEGEADNELNINYSNVVDACQAILIKHEEIEQERIKNAEKNIIIREAKENICLKLKNTLAELKDTNAFLNFNKEPIQTKINALKEEWSNLDSLPLIEEQTIGKSFKFENEQIEKYIKAASNYSILQKDTEKFLKSLTELNDTKSAIPFKKFTFLEKNINALNFPTILGDCCDEIVELKNLLTTVKTRFNKQEEKIAHTKKELPTVLNQLEKEIEDGSLKKANATSKKVRRLLESIPGNTSSLHREFKGLSAKLSNLQDWKGWATSPKMEELCIEMESLINSELHPEELANQVKQLQDNWKKLGGSGQDKTQETWHRFSKAADKAYAPCAEYFAELSETRKQNLELKTNICTELEQTYKETDWSNPNWKKIDIFVTEKINQWKGIGPTDRKPAKEIFQRFNKAVDVLKEKINSYRKNNKTLKEELITSIEALASKEDFKQAIDKTKQAQKQWKDIGPTFRREEQPLWKKFRAACDVIFENRSKHYEEKDNQRISNLNEKNNISEQIEAIAQLPEDDFSEKKKSIPELKDLWHKIDEVPQSEINKVKSRFDNACKAIITQEKKFISQANQEKIKIQEQKYNFCLTTEKNILTGDIPSPEQISDLESNWKDFGSGKKPIDSLLNKRFENLVLLLKSQPSTDKIIEIATDNLHQKQRICLKVEILLGIDSPTAFQKERMDYQIANLADGMKNSTPDQTKEFNKLESDWYLLGIVPNENISELESRFAKAKAAFNTQ